MSELTTTTEPAEAEKSTYLDRFVQAGLIADKENIETLVGKFLEILRNQSRRGTLHAVGGSINKPLPRPE